MNANSIAVAALPPQVKPSEDRLLSFNELKDKLPFGERTLRDQIQRGRIPVIRLPGGRRLLFDWGSVQRALLRFQTGGME